MVSPSRLATTETHIAHLQNLSRADCQHSSTVAFFPHSAPLARAGGDTDTPRRNACLHLSPPSTPPPIPPPSLPLDPVQPRYSSHPASTQSSPAPIPPSALSPPPPHPALAAAEGAGGGVRGGVRASSLPLFDFGDSALAQAGGKVVWRSARQGSARPLSCRLVGFPVHSATRHRPRGLRSWGLGLLRML